ncbi:Uncharacterized protein F44E2.2 [Lasius niger]|uniref:Uncharacterized protein F44E2.2 n=1 Tax=Lasius niger TaxID=67767 RepID=A0A0J7JWB6_LASNI|nr:Uncharacterized protein F44E2.2 [Lasius niger]
MISQYVEQDHRSWDETIPALQYAYNTATHDATEYTPAFLNHGRELATPSPAAPPTGPAGKPDVIRSRLEKAYELVRLLLARAFQRQERYYNLRRRNWRPEVGTWVWKKDHPLSSRAESFNAKLAPKYIGPLEVRRIISPVIVNLRSRQGKWYWHIHVQDLKDANKTLTKNKNINDKDEGELALPTDEPNNEDGDD